MKTQNELIDEAAAEIKYADLKNAIAQDVTIERVRYSGGDTQYRVSGMLISIDRERGTIGIDVKRSGKLRTIVIDDVVKLAVWGSGRPGDVYSAIRDQYDWMREATDDVVECGCRSGFVSMKHRELNDGHVHGEAHGAWIGRERVATYSIWNDDARILLVNGTLDDAVKATEAIAAMYRTNEKFVVQRTGHGTVYEAHGRLHREPTDNSGEKLVPGTVYRVARDAFYPEFAVYRDAVVEDDDSLTLVFETADGRRDGYAEARTKVERIDAGTTVCPPDLDGWTESEKAAAYGK